MRRHGRGSHVRLCRFSDCDETATATVGTVPLCVLHQSYVLQLMDQGVDPLGERSSVSASNDWTLIPVGDLEI